MQQSSVTGISRHLAVLCLLMLSACGGGGSGGSGSNETFAVGGTVSGAVYSGVSGPQLIIFNNGGDAIEHPANGSFAFSTKLTQGTPYNVTVQVSLLSPLQTCAVTNGSGVAGASSANAVSIVCTTSTFAVGGAVTGLTGSGLVLRNGSSTLPVAGNGPFSFPAIASGDSYSIVVASQPSNPGQTCSVTNPAGDVTNAAITNVTVACQPNIYTVSGTVSGLKGTGLSLTVNGASALPIAANGAFTFPANLLANGTQYAVAAASQPTGPAQTCIAPNGAGTVAGASITGVIVICSAPAFAYGAGGHGNDVLAYSINNSSGALSAIGSGSVPAGDTTSAVAVDPAYRFLFAANQGVTSGPGSNTISAYSITAATGALVPVTNSPFASIAAPVSLVVDPTSRFLYVADYHDNTVTAFAISASGALAPITGGPSEPGLDGPRFLTMHPSGKYLYLSVGNESTVWAYAIDAVSGALTLVPGSPFPTITAPGPVSLTPDGATAYFANTNAAHPDLTISASPLSPVTGAFTSFGGTYPLAEPSPTVPAGVISVYDPVFEFSHVGAFALDAEGRGAFVIGRYSASGNDTISPLCLTACGGTYPPDVPLTTQVSWVTVDPSGRFLYVSDVNGNALAYLIDRSNGGLSAAATTAGALVPNQPFVITTQ
jgi:6-phosphogluconolactonase (cycloisomerase 2 family)